MKPVEQLMTGSEWSMPLTAEGWRRRLLVLAGLLALAFLSLYNQPYAPVTWLDEGFTLQGAMNLARDGRYAMRSVEGWRPFDQPLIANGPGVVLPISAVFRLVGINLVAARLVMAVYIVATVGLYHTLARRLVGPPGAIAALFLLLSLPAEGLFLLGRQALGLIPALTYFLAGFLMWLTALERHRARWSLAGGLLIGLAMVTKGQYLLMIPVFAAVALADILYFRQGAARQIGWLFVGFGTILTAWYGAQLLSLGWAGFMANLQVLASSSAVTVTAFRPARIPGNLWYLVWSGILLVIGPAWLWYGRDLPRRTQASLGPLPLLLAIPVWLAWYAFVSVGWHRYAYDAFVMGAVFGGGMVADIWQRSRSGGGQSEARHRLLSATYLAGVFLVSLLGLGSQVRLILVQPNTTPQILAHYLRQNVATDAVVESWEWEIDLLAPDHRFHHPTNDWVDRMTAAVEFGEAPGQVYDLAAYQPDYLLDGPFSKRTGLYTPFLAENCCTLLFRAGEYDLYRLKGSD